MPDGNQQIAAAGNRDFATLPFEQALEVYSPNFAAVLPPDVPLEHFKRMVVTAVNQNPDLRYADRRTLFNACVKCASDGVLPDGREAALVVFRTKVKDREGNERWIDAVNYMIMVAGIRKRLRNTGEVLSADAEVVYRNDRFRFARGDNPLIEHEPAPLEQDPGDVVGSYAIIKLANGEILREVVRLVDIERARKTSKAPDSPAWKNWYDQMARKVALRRCAKAAPSRSGMVNAARMMEQMLSRDDEEAELPPAEDLPAIPPRPRREDFVAQETASETQSFEVVDFVGEAQSYQSAEQARDALLEMLSKARSLKALVGLWESNGGRGADDPVEGNLGEIADALEVGVEPLFEAYEEAKKSFEQHPGEGRQDRPAAGAQSSDPARGATNPAETGHTEHPEGGGVSLGERIESQELPAAGAATPAGAEIPNTSNERPRDEPKSLAVNLIKPAGKPVDYVATKKAMLAVIATKVNTVADVARFRIENRATFNNWIEAAKNNKEIGDLWREVQYHLGDREGVLRSGEP